ncbi:MAG: hypothetical protein ACYC35_01505 [Pirellulales bacterium]
MSPTRRIDLDLEQSKRRLRARIGRLRRQMDRRIQVVCHESAQAVSWRTHVERHPQAALAAALGVGLAMSGGLGRWSRFLERQLLRRAWKMARSRLWQECRTMWSKLMFSENRP